MKYDWAKTKQKLYVPNKLLGAQKQGGRLGRQLIL